MENSELYDFLEAKHQQYNQPDFIASDPISVPHLFTRKEDIEIAGFLTALIAWGKRSLILKSANNWMQRMDMSPYDFVLNASEKELQQLAGFVHRTLNETDARGLTLSLRQIYQEHQGLEGVFTNSLPQNSGQLPAFHRIVQARSHLISFQNMAARTYKHLSNPATNSSAKRLNMFLRWMARKDNRGVDFGLWQIPMSELICPLDVHTGNVSRKLGLLQRTQNDWQAAIILTENLKKFCPEDPVKYDFALFGIGINQEL